MKLNIRSILAAALIGAASSAGASLVTYNMNFTGGGETVSGSITTDGVLGDINGHMLSWEFTLTGSVPFTMSSATGGSIGGSGAVLSASLTSLTLLAPSSIGGVNQQLFFRPGGGSSCGQPTFYFNRSGGTPGYVSANFASDPCNGNGIFGEMFRSSSDVIVATAAPGNAVPEPATGALAGLALAALGVAMSRPRRVSSTSV